MPRLNDNYNNSSIMVFGDSMLDEYIFCEKKKHNILDESYTEKKLGGAANVYMNLKNLGIKKLGLMSIIGNDYPGKELQHLVDPNENYITTDDSIKTTHKKRYVYKSLSSDPDINKYNEFRIDNDNKTPIPINSIKAAINIDLENFLKDSNEKKSIIISDYKKGMITSESLNILDFENLTVKPFLAIDPHIDNINVYLNFKKYEFDLIKLNEREAIGLTNYPKYILKSKNELKNISVDITRIFNSPNAIVVITRDCNGLYCYKKDTYNIDINGYKNYNDNLSNSYNTTGAGDFVIAYLCSMLANKIYDYTSMIMLLVATNKYSRKTIKFSSPYTACWNNNIIPFGHL